MGGQVRLSPVRGRGRYQGMDTMSWSGAALVAPLMSGVVIDRRGAEWLRGLCEVIGSVAGVQYWALKRGMPVADGNAAEKWVAGEPVAEKWVAGEPVAEKWVAGEPIDRETADRETVVGTAVETAIPTAARAEAPHTVHGGQGSPYGHGGRRPRTPTEYGVPRTTAEAEPPRTVPEANAPSPTARRLVAHALLPGPLRKLHRANVFEMND